MQTTDSINKVSQLSKINTSNRRQCRFILAEMFETIRSFQILVFLLGKTSQMALQIW